MQVIEGIANLSSPLKVGALTIGNFDGVHIGHQALLRKLVTIAEKVRAPTVVMTFAPHPMEVLREEQPSLQLFGRDDQIQRLTACGVNYLIIEPFTHDLARLLPEVFIEHYIWRPFQPHTVLVGYDFVFGHQRSGNVERLAHWLRERGARVEQVAATRWGGEVVSSSRVRACLAKAKMGEARELLGRFYYMEGTIVPGAGRGRQMNLPTANIPIPSDRALVRSGVYATWTWLEDQCWPSVTNVGSGPTFAGAASEIRIETHILKFSGDLYGQKVRIEFVDYLRPEVKFQNMEELRLQIQHDIQAAKRVLDV